MKPKVNQILYLQISSTDEEEAMQQFKSRIAEVTDEYISMEVPLNEKTGKFKKLYVGDDLAAYYMSDGGVKNHFISSVIGFKEDVIRLVVIKNPDPETISKEQRRSFLRVPAELELAVKFSEQLQFLAFTEDVGGGGVSFVCDGYIPLSLNGTVSCWILVHYKNGSIEHIPFKGEMVRIKPLETGKQLVMMRFTEIGDRDRQKVIRFCFERQLDFRKR
ncbi:MAG: glycosyl transferase [Paenibacillaceae bacterium]|nr:glycosyl transferase [Paenibacillaceae bacterium]